MNQAVSILVIEDEEIWLYQLKELLKDLGYEITAAASNFNEAVLALNKNDFDLVLLDINLEGQNLGIELGKMIHSLYKKPFIFITGSTSSHTIQEASGVQPSAYLVKPPSPASLFIAIQNALNRFINQNQSTEKKEEVADFIFVKQGNKYKKIFWDDVLSVNSDKQYSILYNLEDKKEYYIRSTLTKTLEIVIPEIFRKFFIQINRTQALQVKFIEEIGEDFIKTKFGDFTLGETYKSSLKQKLTLLS